MSENPHLEITPHAMRGLFGVARRDVTPPVGIYARQWGAALHDVAEGVHRPLALTVLVIRAPADDDAPPLALLALDGTWFRVAEDEWSVRGAAAEVLDVDGSRVMLSLSHTHAACSLSSEDADKPGGHLIGPYLEALARAVGEASKEALERAVPCTLTWAVGRCDLAVNRNLPDPDPQADRFVVAYNPEGPAEDALVIGRLTRNSDDTHLATIANYGCHPTTLAWDNRLISPDYIGAARETVESHTGGAPMLFLQGASGELSPAHQYTGDTAVADRNGRRLGLAVLGTLESMHPPGFGLRYEGAVSSGADLGLWRPAPAEPGDARIDALSFPVSLPMKPMPSEEEVAAELASCQDRVMAERLSRQLSRVRLMGTGTHSDVTVTLWRVGQALFVALPYECYSVFQRQLREAFTDYTVVVMNDTNGPAGSYLYPPDQADERVYQVWVSPYSGDALTILTETCIARINAWLGPE